jgi:hypothetical protein
MTRSWFKPWAGGIPPGFLASRGDDPTCGGLLHASLRGGGPAVALGERHALRRVSIRGPLPDAAPLGGIEDERPGRAELTRPLARGRGAAEELCARRADR